MFKVFTRSILFFSLTFVTLSAQTSDFVLNHITRNYDQQHLKLELRVDFDKEKIAGTATLRVATLEDDFRELILHSRSSKVFVVLVDGKQCKFELENGLLTIRLNRAYQAGEILRAEIRYSAEPATGLYFFRPTQAHPEIPYQVWSQGQDEDNRHWIPYYDLPDDKLSSEMIVTIPENMRAFSNGDLLEVRADAGKHEATFHWKTDFEHSGYLITLVAGEYVTFSDSTAGVPLNYNVPADLADTDPNYPFGRTPAMVNFFSDYICPYPYSHYDQNAVQDFRWGGMENTTATTLNRRIFHDERAVPNYSADDLIAHELAHQWFGDLLTCRTWDHIWLNEGLTTYFTDLFFEHHYGADEFRMRRVTQNREYIASLDKQPIDTIQPRYDENVPVELFGGKAYDRGAAIAHMLRYELGDSLFQAGIRRYVDRYRYQNVESEDFRKVMEEVSGKDLRQFFKQWVYGAGYPKFNVWWEWDDTLKAVQLYIDQVQDTLPAMDVFQLSVPVEIQSGTEILQVQPQLHHRKHRFTYKMNKAPDLVRFDKHHWILKEVSFKKSFGELFYQVIYDQDVTGREWAAGQLASAGNEAVPVLARAYRQEKFYWVRQRIVQSLAEIATPAALETIRRAAADPDARVREEAMKALGNFAAKDVQELLTDRLHNDGNDYVRGAAAASLGKVKADHAFDIIKEMLKVDSHRNIIRRGVFQGMAQLRDPRALTYIRQYSQYRYSYGGMHLVDQEALKCAMVLAEDHRAEVVEAIMEIVKNPYFRTRNKAAQMLAELKAREALPLLHEILAGERREFVRSVLEKAVEQLRAEG